MRVKLKSVFELILDEIVLDGLIILRRLANIAMEVLGNLGVELSRRDCRNVLRNDIVWILSLTGDSNIASYTASVY